MSVYSIQAASLINIADAIRAKGGSTAQMNPDEIATAIGKITGGGAALNIAYGDTEPADTTKLWVKCNKPAGVQITTDLGAKNDGLAENHLLIEVSGANKLFRLSADMEVSIQGVYLGNSEGIAEEVTACLYENSVDYYKSSATELTSGTVLTASVECFVGDLVVAAIATRDTLTLSEGWTLISTSDTNSNDSTGQRLSWAYKFAESTTESITVTQASAQRMYINMIALQGATGVTDCGYAYCNAPVEETHKIDRPNGLVLWAMAAPLWSPTQPYETWFTDAGILILQLGEDTQPRLAIGLDQTNADTLVFYPGARISASGTTIIIGALTIQGLEQFYTGSADSEPAWIEI